MLKTRRKETQTKRKALKIQNLHDADLHEFNNLPTGDIQFLIAYSYQPPHPFPAGTHSVFREAELPSKPRVLVTFSLEVYRFLGPRYHFKDKECAVLAVIEMISRDATHGTSNREATNALPRDVASGRGMRADPTAWDFQYLGLCWILNRKPRCTRPVGSY